MLAIIFLFCMTDWEVFSLDGTLSCWENNGFGILEVVLRYKENERQETGSYLQKGNTVIVYCKTTGACLVMPSLLGDVQVTEAEANGSRVITVTVDKLYGRISPEGSWSLHHAQTTTLNNQQSCYLSMSDFLLMTFNGKRAQHFDFEEGSILNVKCQQSHAMTSNLDIFKDDEKIAESVNDSSVTWNKSDISCSDSGTYRCKRRKSTKFVTTTVLVLCAPKLIGTNNDVIDALFTSKDQKETITIIADQNMSHVLIYETND